MFGILCLNDPIQYTLTPVRLLMAGFSDPFPFNTRQEESVTYQGQLDRLEAELLKYRAELSSMQSINSNALQTKEEAKVDCISKNAFKMIVLWRKILELWTINSWRFLSNSTTTLLFPGWAPGAGGPVLQGAQREGASHRRLQKEGWRVQGQGWESRPESEYKVLLHGGGGSFHSRVVAGSRFLT